jgi:hypothetical protein
MPHCAKGRKRRKGLERDEGKDVACVKENQSQRHWGRSRAKGAEGAGCGGREGAKKLGVKKSRSHCLGEKKLKA